MANKRKMISYPDDEPKGKRIQLSLDSFFTRSSTGKGSEPKNPVMIELPKTCGSSSQHMHAGKIKIFSQEDVILLMVMTNFESNFGTQKQMR